MNDDRAIRDGRSLTERYEALREAALGGRRAPGLASVHQQGVWAWVELVCAEEPPSPPCTPTPQGRRRALTPHVLAELVDVWIHLALDCAQEAP